jgi:hypothetical protein
MKYLALLLLIPSIAFADVKEQAIAGQAADAATTIIGISQGLAETNPLGAPAAILIKPFAFLAIDRLDEEDKVIGHSALSAAGWGATGNNLCVLVGGGIGCLFVGIASGIVAWNQTVQERQFWEWCAYFRKEQPELECVWTD